MELTPWQTPRVFCVLDFIFSPNVYYLLDRICYTFQKETIKVLKLPLVKGIQIVKHIILYWDIYETLYNKFNTKVFLHTKLHLYTMFQFW